MDICLLLPFRPDQGADLGHINVTELLHSLSDLVLVSLEVHSEHKCVVLFYFLRGRLGGQGELDDGTVVKLTSPRGTLSRIFGPTSKTVLGC